MQAFHLLFAFQESKLNGDIVDGRMVDSGSSGKLANGDHHHHQQQQHQLHPHEFARQANEGLAREEDRGESPDDGEKEERRRTAQRVFSKQG